MNQTNYISVITINYNNIYDTCCFIDSWINSINSFKYEIIVIDNGSINDESILLKNKYPNIITIRSDNNLGFAGANNLGFKSAKGDLLFFLNNDTKITNDTLLFFVNELLSSKNLAGISPLILNDDIENSIQYAGFTNLSKITLRNKVLYEGKDNNSIKDGYYTPFLHGAAMLIKRSAINEVGLMDENYFLYYEEMDWCEKFIRKGYKLYFSPSFKIIHKNSSTIGINSPLKAYYLTRNRLLFAYKNRSKSNLFFIILYHICFAYPFHIMKAIFRRRRDIAIAEINGIIDYFKLTL